MGFGYYALKNGDWEEYKRTFKAEVSATEWTFGSIREAFERLARDEAGNVSIVQRIMLKSTDFLRRIIAPAGGQGGVTLFFVRIAIVFHFRTYMWWVSAGKKHCIWWCANCGEHMKEEHTTGCWVYKQVTVPVRQRCSQRMRCRKVCVCENLINALKVAGEPAEGWR